MRLPIDRPRSGARRITVLATLATAAILLQACGSTSGPTSSKPQIQQQAGGPQSSYARPAAPSKGRYDVVGVASWYGKPYHGRKTASGQVYNMYQMTAAHPSLPFGTRVAVTNLDNGRTVVVTINDRGPFVKGRIIDVSRKAASKLGFLNDGLTRVGVRIVSPSQG
ncbi:MAG: septal ring lytic transglycosylase RlpA family protein [Pseudomonadota bacterium]